MTEDVRQGDGNGGEGRGPGPPASRLVALSDIKFDFVPLGHVANADLSKQNRLFLDVGNALGPGVIDHHQLAAYLGSAAGLVITHPELIDDAVGSGVGAFTITLHADPDIDCVASAYLAQAWLTTGGFRTGSVALARYIDNIDIGHPAMVKDRPFSLYAAYMALAHRLSMYQWRSVQDRWNRTIRDGLEIVEFVLSRMEERQLPIVDIDAFDCPGHFRARDREEILQDIERYVAKLSDPDTCARRCSVRLPSHLGGYGEADALLVRHVQADDDPTRCVFFKDWARTDRERSSLGKGFTALAVFEPQSASSVPTVWISVPPDSELHIQGLAAMLDEAEATERIRRLGVDDRVEDPGTHEVKTPRPGYTNADPWYDGRAHDFTIVGSPRSGTVLSADTIETIFIAFGGDAEGRSQPLPASEDEAESEDGRDRALRRISKIVRLSRGEDGGLSTRQPSIFISYPRSRLAWVKENIYTPLVSRYGADEVFFDTHSLEPGSGWYAGLARAVEGSRIFLAVYCPEYFRSDWCQWELETVCVRDPRGKQGLLLPLMVDPVTVPPTCKLIQSLDASREGFWEQLWPVLEARLNAGT
jgi:hypothetical protein